MNAEKTGLTNTSPNAKPASKGQQAQFDLLLGRCRQMMEASAEEWLATLKQDPVQGAVMLGTGTLRELAMQSQKAGQEVDPAVLVQTGVQFLKDICAVANAAGFVPDDQLKPFLQDAMQQSMAEYLEMDRADGLLSPQDKERGAAIVDGAGQGAPAQPPDGMPPEEPMPEEEPQGMLARMQKGGA